MAGRIRDSFFALGLAFGALAFPSAALGATPTSDLPSGIILTTQDAGVASNPGKAITFPVDVMNNASSPQAIQLKVLSAPKAWTPTFQDRGYDVSAVDLLPGKDDTVTFQVSPPAATPPGQTALKLEAVSDSGLTADLTLNIDINKSAPGNVKLTTDYPILKGASGSKFEFKATIANNTGKDQTFSLSASGPKDWLISFQPAYATKEISSIGVKSAQTQDVNVEVTAPDNAKPADYPIGMKVADETGDAATADMKVTIIGNYKLDLSTPTQQLNTQATAGQAKTLSIVVANTGTAPVQNITLSAGSTPSGWTMTFKPDKLDVLDPGTVRQVEATLTPAAKAIAGDYSLNLSATSTQASVNKDFRVTVQTPTIWGWVGIGIVVVVVGGLLWLFQTHGRR